MGIYERLDRLHPKIKVNIWYRFFAIFCRLGLAAGFIPAGLVKIMGERFASGLSDKHPMGAYLTALHQTGYYYSFIGYLQIAAALLLLIPQTAALGALIYFPIILNICILSYAVRFDGSLLTSPLMVLANLYLICWYYDRIRFILPFYRSATIEASQSVMSSRKKFPFAFFGAVVFTVFLVFFASINLWRIKPRNSMNDCLSQCPGRGKPKACEVFCDCIHNKGQSLDSCIAQYNKAPEEKTVR